MEQRRRRWTWTCSTSGRGSLPSYMCMSMYALVGQPGTDEGALAAPPYDAGLPTKGRGAQG
eukprot:scaffold3124_cov390-Prasinococcus_capsulatus_cf.AAC.3